MFLPVAKSSLWFQLLIIWRDSHKRYEKWCSDDSLYCPIFFYVFWFYDNTTMWLINVSIIIVFMKIINRHKYFIQTKLVITWMRINTIERKIFAFFCCYFVCWHSHSLASLKALDHSIAVVVNWCLFYKSNLAVMPRNNNII